MVLKSGNPQGLSRPVMGLLYRLLVVNRLLRSRVHKTLYVWHFCLLGKHTKLDRNRVWEFEHYDYWFTVPLTKRTNALDGENHRCTGMYLHQASSILLLFSTKLCKVLFIYTIIIFCTTAAALLFCVSPFFRVDVYTALSSCDQFRRIFDSWRWNHYAVSYPRTAENPYFLYMRENQKVKAKYINRSNCEQFYISFFYIVPMQHNAFVILFN